MNSVEQSEDNSSSPGVTYKHPQKVPQRPSQSHLALDVCMVWSEYSDYKATLANFFTQKYLEFIFETSQDYCMDIGLYVCKSISLDGKYFMVIFHVKFGENILEFNRFNHLHKTR